MNNCCHDQEQIKFKMDIIVDSICDKNVVPIIGEELLKVESNLMFDVCSKWINTLKNYYKLEIEPDIGRIEPLSLEKVAFELLNKNIKLNVGKLIRALEYVFNKNTFSSSTLFQLLAKIEDFKLYITTTVDPFLEYSIKKIRYNDDTEKFNNSIIINKLNDLKDLAPEFDKYLNKIENPILYYLFGKVNYKPDFVISEEDRLEFMHKILRSNELINLRNQLSDNDIIIIGSLYSNWLARFFIRFLSGTERLSSDKKNITWIVGQNIDEKLYEFCESPLCNNYEIIKTDNISVFVKDLYEEWKKKAEEKGAVKKFSLDNDQINYSKPLNSLIPFVFLSYCREDEIIAKKIHNQLNKNGIQVWFDNKELSPGENFENTIIKKIRKCTLFCPLISENTERLRDERRFFIMETNEALEEKKKANHDKVFVVPIVTSKNVDTHRIPKELERLNYIYLDDNNDIPENKIKELVSEIRKRQTE